MPPPVPPQEGGSAAAGIGVGHGPLARQLEEILIHMSDAFIAMDRDWRIITVNPAYLKLVAPLDLKVEDLVGHTLWEKFPEVATQEVGQRYRRAMELQREDRMELLSEALGRWLEVRMHPTPETLAIFIQDITERKQAEATLRISEERYRTLFTSLDDGFCVFEMIYDASGKPVDYRFTEVNASFERHTGLKDALGRTIKEMVPTHEPHWFEIYGRIAETGVPEHFTRVGAGMNRWFEVRAFRMGAPELRQVAAIFSDVTQRYMTEKALRESEERYRSLFNSIDEGVCLCQMLYDENGTAMDYRILEVNPAYVSITGIPEQEALSKTARQLVPDHDVLVERYASVIATGQPLRYQAYVAGIEKWLDIHVTRSGGDGSPFFVPVFSDITARRQAEQALKESKEAAESANAAKDRFLAILSHELRTPLTPVLMTAAAREHDPDLPHVLREEMTMIRRNVELETKLIDDLLDLSRITTGKLALRLESVDLNTIVRHVCGICRPQILEKEVLLRLELDPNAGLVRVDPARLQQILWNVVKNAAKFTPRGGWIHVRTHRIANERTCVRVADSGIGISPEVLPRIFDAFEQADEQIMRQFGGLGLGLAISKALAELHGGSITASSSGEGSGSTFVLELPVAREERSLKSVPSDFQPEPNPQSVRVLLVEDHPDTARVLAMLLRRAGFNVDTAVSVASALELANANAYDLLVSDLGLPDGSGYELMKRVRETRPIKGIAMSGFGMDRDVQKSLLAGFSEHVVKPVDIGQLQAAMRRAVER
jgi:PAS domain S-box-containing protein